MNKLQWLINSNTIIRTYTFCFVVYVWLLLCIVLIRTNITYNIRHSWSCFLKIVNNLRAVCLKTRGNSINGFDTLSGKRRVYRLLFITDVNKTKGNLRFAKPFKSCIILSCPFFPFCEARNNNIYGFSCLQIKTVVESVFFPDHATGRIL